VDAGNYPRFADFYSGYFHPDWRLDDSSADEVVGQYKRTQPGEAIDTLKEELAQASKENPSEDALRAALGPFTTYDPADDGLSVHEWIDHLVRQLDGPIV
jgi:hypothetical protein